jgi:hypothetical protein
MIFQFFAHATPSLYGEGDINSAATFTHCMNQRRACDPWDFKQVDQAHGPLLDIAAELARHKAARFAR